MQLTELKNYLVKMYEYHTNLPKIPEYAATDYSPAEGGGGGQSDNQEF